MTNQSQTSLILLVVAGLLIGGAAAWFALGPGVPPPAYPRTGRDLERMATVRDEVERIHDRLWKWKKHPVRRFRSELGRLNVDGTPVAFRQAFDKILAAALALQPDDPERKSKEAIRRLAALKGAVRQLTRVIEESAGIPSAATMESDDFRDLEAYTPPPFDDAVTAADLSPLGTDRQGRLTGALYHLERRDDSLKCWWVVRAAEPPALTGGVAAADLSTALQPAGSANPVAQQAAGVVLWFTRDQQDIMADDDMLMILQSFALPRGLSGAVSLKLKAQVRFADDTEETVTFTVDHITLPPTTP